METYNGYANYETWLISVWIDNEQGSIDFWVNVAKYHYEQAKETKFFTRQEEAVFTFADDMKEYFEDNIPDSTEIGGLYADMLYGCMIVVDWGELATKYMEQAMENIAV